MPPLFRFVAILAFICCKPSEISESAAGLAGRTCAIGRDTSIRTGILLDPLFRRLRLIPRYTLYPAPLKDPALQSPAWGVVGGIWEWQS